MSRDTALDRLHRLGACRGSRLDFTDVPDGQRRPDPDIAAVCWRCPVVADCLDYALDNEVEDGEEGVWGGTTPYQRAALKRDLHRVKCPACGSEAVQATPNRGEVCLSCGIGWMV